MKVKSLKFTNYRALCDVHLDLDDRMTVLAGLNGTGKSAVLDGLACMLSWLTARVRNPQGKGQLIEPMHIHNDKHVARIQIVGEYNDQEVGWQTVRYRRGHHAGGDTSDFTQLKMITNRLGRQIENSPAVNLPLFAYYPVQRAVLDIPLRIRKSHRFDPLEAWDDSLVSAANFRRFFEWFRNREDLENEQRLGDLGVDYRDKQLNAVRKALHQFLPGFDRFRIQRNPLRMTVEKDQRELRVDQLSDGEKCMLALVGDLARRLAIANPASENPLHGSGVVLIDEIDLHLHPAWQRMIVSKLREAFPRCQFVISTHSPQVLGEVHADQVRLLQQNDDNQVEISQAQQTYGLTSNEILDAVMASDGGFLSRNEQVTKALDKIFEFIDDKNFDGARRQMDDLRKRLAGDVPDLVRAATMITLYGPKA